MKNLKENRQFRVQPSSFLLLKQLIDLTDPKKISVFLSVTDFLPVLNDTLDDLEDAVFAGFEDAQSESESSHTIVSTPSQNESGKKRGMKRKRPTESGNSDAMEIDEASQTPTSPMLAYVYLLDCLYSLVVLATEALEDDVSARLQLSQAIMYKLESGAIMMGKSLRIAAAVTSSLFRRRMTTQLQHLMYVLPAILGMWGVQTTNKRRPADQARDVCST